MTEVVIDGITYRPVEEEEAAELGEQLRSFTLEGSEFWRRQFILRDTNQASGARLGMYADGDEKAPFFTEAFLYNLVGKDEARSILGMMRRLCVLAGVEFR